MQDTLETAEFMSKEHEAGFHTSDDWANLKDRCPECFKLSKKYSGGVIVGTSLHAERTRYDDPRFGYNANPIRD